jgi:hypothetical protein
VLRPGPPSQGKEPATLSKSIPSDSSSRPRRFK